MTTIEKPASARFSLVGEQEVWSNLAPRGELLNLKKHDQITLSPEVSVGNTSKDGRSCGSPRVLREVLGVLGGLRSLPQRSQSKAAENAEKGTRRPRGGGRAFPELCRSRAGATLGGNGDFDIC